MITQLLFILIFGIILLISVINPFYLLGLIIILNRFNIVLNSLQTSKIATVSRILGVFVALGWIINFLVVKGSYIIKYKKLNAALIIFAISGFISSFNAEFKKDSFMLSFRILLLILMVFFLQDFLRKKKNAILFVKIVAISAGVTGLLGLIQFLLLKFSGIRIGEAEFGYIYGPRIAGFVENPNGFAAILMSGIPFLFFLYIIENNKQWMYLLLIISSIVSLFLTQSRTHIFGFFLFSSVFLLVSLRAGLLKRGNFYKWMIAIISVLIILKFTPRGVYERVITYTFSGEDYSSKVRIQILKKGIYLFSKNPFWGIGYDNLQKIYVDRYPVRNGAHDMISMVLTSTGIWGFTFLILAIVFSLNKYFSLFNKIKDSPTSDFWKILILVSFSGYIEILSTFLGNTIILQRIFWIYLTMPFIIEQLMKPENVQFVSKTDKDSQSNENVRIISSRFI